MQELAKAYEESAALIRARLSELRKELRAAENPEIVWRLKRRIAALEPMLTDCNALAEYCRNYYDRGYFIGYGPLKQHRNNKQCATLKHCKKNTFYNGRGVVEL